jgi:hypothetical protein
MGSVDERITTSTPQQAWPFMLARLGNWENENENFPQAPAMLIPSMFVSAKCEKV